MVVNIIWAALLLELDVIITGPNRMPFMSLASESLNARQH